MVAKKISYVKSLDEPGWCEVHRPDALELIIQLKRFGFRYRDPFLYFGEKKVGYFILSGAKFLITCGSLDYIKNKEER